MPTIYSWNGDAHLPIRKLCWRVLQWPNKQLERISTNGQPDLLTPQVIIICNIDRMYGGPSVAIAAIVKSCTILR